MAMNESTMIDNRWQFGGGQEWASTNPLDSSALWQGRASDRAQVDAAVDAATRAGPAWRKLTVEERMVYVDGFVECLKRNSESLARLITRENGKALWDAQSEVAAMIGKAAISLRAYHDRTGILRKQTAQGQLTLQHKPHGVLAVFGPFNFPGHLPNGHIIPALIAGNTVIFKPSELTPAVACHMVKLWCAAGLPAGVLNLVCGDKITGAALVEHPGVDGLLFTGSAQTGRYLHQQFSGQTHKVLALEMGGNNPFLIEPVQDVQAAVFTVLFSAFVSSGQRCTCARRLLLPIGDWGDQFLQALLRASSRLRVAGGETDPQPFMATLISADASVHLQQGIQLLETVGGVVLLPASYHNDAGTLMTPVIVDMTNRIQAFDDELFGPILQVYRYHDLDEGIALANATRFGLAAGMVTDSLSHYEYFCQQIRAGIVNLNKPLTGASSEAPFGGVGASGNHQPSAYYAADYCAYPVASLSADRVSIPTTLPPGIQNALD